MQKKNKCNLRKHPMIRIHDFPQLFQISTPKNTYIVSARNIEIYDNSTWNLSLTKIHSKYFSMF